LSHTLALHRPKNGATTTIPSPIPNTISIIRTPLQESYRRFKGAPIADSFIFAPPGNLRGKQKSIYHKRAGLVRSALVRREHAILTDGIMANEFAKSASFKPCRQRYRFLCASRSRIVLYSGDIQQKILVHL
jgi:hypothetical protein